MSKKKKRKSTEPLSEFETRRSILSDCHLKYGPEAVRQLKIVFNKWDRALENCKNENELKHMKIMAISEIHRMMNYLGGLSVNGQTIIDE